SREWNSGLRRNLIMMRWAGRQFICKRAMSRGERQAESYFAPSVGMVTESNSAALSLDQQFAGIEAQTGGLACFLARPRLTMIEFLEDVRQVGRSNPATCVA